MELRSLKRVRPLEFIEALPDAAVPVAELRVEPFMLLSELLFPEFQSEELDPRFAFPDASSALYVPEVVAPVLFISVELLSMPLEVESPVREPVVEELEDEEDGVGDVVFAFGLPTCELVDCASAPPATSAPASKIAEQV